jgi:hypothetical protein
MKKILRRPLPGEAEVEREMPAWLDEALEKVGETAVGESESLSEETAHGLMEQAMSEMGPVFGEVAERSTRTINWRDRLWFWLFPSRYCPVPEDDQPVKSCDWEDCMVMRHRIELSWLDRLRVLVSGRITVESKTVTEFAVGANKTNSVMYANAPHWLEGDR